MSWGSHAGTSSSLWWQKAECFIKEDRAASKDSKDVKVALPGESRWQKKSCDKSHRWESEQHKERGWPVECFRNHVTSDGSLLGTSGKWRTCGRSVVQLDHEGNEGPMHGMRDWKYRRP